MVIKKSESKINKNHKVTNFPNANVESIEDLTHMGANIDSLEYFDEENFRQILKITLKKKGKEEVLKTIRKLEKHKAVLSAEPNYFMQPTEIEEDLLNEEPNAISNDTYYGDQWALSKINASGAWDITKGSSTVKVGIIDTGIASHADLNSNVVAEKDFFNNNSITTDDTYSHGTHIAGTIGSVGNNVMGTSGINWNATLVPLQVIITDGSASDGYFSGTAIIKAITYAIDNNIPIIR